MIAPTFEWDPKKAAFCWWRSSTIRVEFDLSALGRPPDANAMPMKKARRRPGDAQDDLRPEYDFDYSKAKANPYAARLSGAAVTVVLDPDVAAVFRTSEAVNKVLRSAVAAIPRRSRVGRTARRRSALTNA